MCTLEVKRTCPICGGNKADFLYHISMISPSYFPITGEYDVVSCQECGFIYADVEGTQENYNKYYATCNTYSSISNLKKEAYGKICNYRANFLDKYLNKSDKILDIGCGSGDLLKELRKRGFYRLYGIDPSPKSVQSLEQEGIEGNVGNIFDDVPEKLKGAFDVVCCTAVLEHIYDIKEAIKKISGYMKPEKGKLFLDVPAVEGFEKFREKLPNYFNHEHINYFSLQSLDNLLTSIKFNRINKKEDGYYVLDLKIAKPELILQGLYEYQKEDKCMTKDLQSTESVKRYFKIIEEENNKGKEILRQVISQRRNIIIWGTGNYAQWLLQEIPEIKEYICFFIDNNEEKQGTFLCGQPIYGPDILKNQERENVKDAVIVICSIQNAQEIADQIDQMNINYKYLILK